MSGSTVPSSNRTPLAIDAVSVSLVSSASITLAVRIAVFALALATNIILARSLGSTGRGVYAIAVVVPFIIALISSVGIGPANVYHVSRGSLEKRHVVAASLASALLLGAGAYALLALATTISGTRSLLGVAPRYLLVSGISLPFLLAAAFLQGVLQGERRFLHLNVVLLSQAIAQAALLAMLLPLPVDRLYWSIAAWTASWIVSGSFAILLVGRHTPISLGFHLPTIRATLRYGSVTYLGTLTSFVNYRFDLLLVNIFSGATQVGLYAVGAGLAEIIWFVPNSVAIALAPTVAAAPEAQSSNLSAQATRSVLVIAVAMALVMAALAPLAIFLFFGQAFMQSAVAVWLLLPGIVTFSVWKIMSCYLLGRHLLKQDLVAATVAMIATLVLDLLLIPTYGFRGAAVASSIAYTSAMLVDLYWVAQRSRLSARIWIVATPADIQAVVRSLRRLHLWPTPTGSKVA